MIEYFDKFLWLILFVVAYFIFSFFINRFRSKNQESAIDWKTKNLTTRLLTVQRLYIETLQRELANIILDDSIETLESAFHAVAKWEDEITGSRHDRQFAEYRALIEKFPNFEDFDLIGTKHFVRYNHLNSWTIDDLVERYKEISKFLILDHMFGESDGLPRKRRDGKDSEFFRRTIQSYKDRRLSDELKKAMIRFSEQGGSNIFPNDFEDDEYQVTQLWRRKDREFSPELQYGIFCKKLNEYGIHSFFAGNEDYTHKSYYRSDPTFSSTHVLIP